MSGSAPQQRQASVAGSMTTGGAIAVIINQYLTWRGITSQPDFPIAVVFLATSAVHAMQVAALALLDRVSPVKAG